MIALISQDGCEDSMHDSLLAFLWLNNVCALKNYDVIPSNVGVLLACNFEDCHLSILRS